MKLHRFAKDLRKSQTDAERQMWFLLKSRRLERWKFRRQHPVGPYIADFCCLEKRFIIELDGGQHIAEKDKDASRTAFLEKEGYHVLRFWDNDVLQRIDAVVEVIYNAMNQLPGPSFNCLPHPDLLPRRGEGKIRKSLSKVST